MQVVAAILIVLGGLLSFANWMTVVQTSRTKKFYSAVPFFGAGLLGCGFLVLPATRNWAWSAVLLDYGTLAFVFAVPRLLHETWNTSRFNLLYDFSGRLENKSVRLCLFRKGIFTIRITVQRPAGQSGLVGTGTTGTWRMEVGKLKMGIHGGDSAVFNLSKISGSEFLRQESGFSRFENDPETSLTGMKLMLNSKTPLASA